LQDKDTGPSRGLIPLEIKRVPRALYEKQQLDKQPPTAIAMEKGKEKAKDDSQQPFKNEDDDDEFDSSSNTKTSKSRRKRKRPVTDEEFDQELFGSFVEEI